MSTNPAITDLSAVIPDHQTFTIDGKDVLIRQVKIGQLPAVLRAVQPLSHMLRQDAPFDLQGMFMLHADDCLTLLQVLSGQSRVWVDELEVDDALKLFSALLEVNLDFFVLRILPLLPQGVSLLRAKAAALTSLVGQMPSSASSKTATT